jgi:hypothetical protein
MKRFALVAAAGMGAAAILVTGCTPLGGPPLNVMVSAATDTTVLVTWTTPAEGTADAYLVYFRGVRDTGFTLIADTTGTSFEHWTRGATGRYKVSAKYGGTTYESQDTTVSTVPVHTETLAIYELNIDSSRSGYGWDTLTGEGAVRSMAQATNAGLVDLYCSDLTTGHSRLPWVIMSPDRALTNDSGAANIVPGANWHKNGFANILGIGEEQGPLPGYDSLPPNYFIYTEVSQTPSLVPVYTNCDRTEDKRHYALIKVHSVDTLAGRMLIETWYQRVPRLRLMQH